MTSPIAEAHAFSQVYERTHLSVFRFIYALHGGPQTEIEDLTAETYLRAWRSRHRYQGTSQEAIRWLLTIARNLVIDSHRHNQRRAPTMELDQDAAEAYFPDPGITPEEAMAEREAFQEGWRILQTLEPQQREIILLRYLFGWAVQDIAEHLDLLENTVSVKIRRIVNQLQKISSETNE